jgi:protein-tyrosine phosphatase
LGIDKYLYSFKPQTQRLRRMNIRDISNFNENIKPKQIFRSGEVNSISDLEELRKYGINNILDFRCEYEIKLNDYSTILPNDIYYINIPIETHHAEILYEGTPMESVYQYFALDCKNLFKTIIQQIINLDGSILMTCRYGMDRTGVIITIIHLICNTPKGKIKEDYLQSGSIIVGKHLDIFLNILDTYDSIIDYFKNELSINEIETLKIKLLKP